MNPDLSSTRAKEARLANVIGKTGSDILAILSLIALASGVALAVIKDYRQAGWLMLALGTLLLTIYLWYSRRLAKLPAQINSSKLEDKLSADLLAQLPVKPELTPKLVWQSLKKDWQLIFFTNHLLLSPDTIEELLSDSSTDLNQAWQQATNLALNNNAKAIESGYVVAGLILSSQPVQQLLTRMKLQPNDIKELAGWLARGLDAMREPKQNFGGIGRDWAFGYTPLLSRFGVNISLAIAGHGAHFGWLTNSGGVQAVENILKNKAGSVALIGESGSGKTSHVYALAQRLMEGKTDKTLAYHQIIGLNASQIISSARGSGTLEQIMLSLINEASHASHIILFFDDADLFLRDGAGAFDATRILQPLLQDRVVSAIFALSPTDFQRLRSNNPSFAGLLTSVNLQEPDEQNTLRVLEDTAVGLENKHKIIIALEAIKEAYNLSGRYTQDKAYPGRAIDLLEQAVPNAVNNKIMTAGSVQQAIEQSTGAKVISTGPAEAQELLNLEAKIHERMINQKRAVEVVSSALRRARAGISNTTRPIGSFLFLGPTGVGKTELAKSIAATYFNSEKNMIRLDMSEYQQDNDIDRLLATGASESSSLIMSIRQTPFAVILLDEIEKAHPNILNLLLQLLDEGQLTDASGKQASFKDAVIICTSNAGADIIRQKIDSGEELASFEKDLTDQLINTGQFKPELLNRYDEIVLFRPLKPDELSQVVRLMLAEVNQTLANQNITVELTDAATAKIVEQGNDSRFGARPMRRAVQKMVEDKVASEILKGNIQAGDKLTLDAQDLAD